MPLCVDHAIVCYLFWFRDTRVIGSRVLRGRTPLRTMYPLTQPICDGSRPWRMLSRARTYLSTKDGVTVAKEIQLENHFENMGAQMVREVASKNSDVAGDGMTTATVLAQAIYREGLQQVTAGHNPMELKRGIDQAVQTVVEELRALSRDVKDKKEIAQVGTISANNDSTIGDLIAEAMERVGKDGVITVEEGKTTETTLDIVEGMQFDRGYISPYFVTNAERMEGVLEGSYILLYEKKLSKWRTRSMPRERRSKKVRWRNCNLKANARSA